MGLIPPQEVQGVFWLITRRAVPTGEWLRKRGGYIYVYITSVFFILIKNFHFFNVLIHHGLHSYRNTTLSLFFSQGKQYICIF